MSGHCSFAAQEQLSGGNFHTNKDAGGMWCRDHSGRGTVSVVSSHCCICHVVSLYASLVSVYLTYFLFVTCYCGPHCSQVVTVLVWTATGLGFKSRFGDLFLIRSDSWVDTRTLPVSCLNCGR